MNKMLMMLGAAFVWLGFMTMPLPAQETAAEDTAEEQSVSVADMLKEVKYATSIKPKKKVYVYFFVRSHSGCGPCRVIVPSCINFYKEMKGKGAEIIMLNSDADAAKAGAWAKEAGMTYPVITPETRGKVKVPVGGTGGTPNVVAVTEDGKVLDHASGYKKCPVVIGNWKNLVKEAKLAEKEKKAASGKKKSNRKKEKNAGNPKLKKVRET